MTLWLHQLGLMWLSPECKSCSKLRSSVETLINEAMQGDGTVRVSMDFYDGFNLKAAIQAIG